MFLAKQDSVSPLARRKEAQGAASEARTTSGRVRVDGERLTCKENMRNFWNGGQLCRKSEPQVPDDTSPESEQRVRSRAPSPPC